MSTLQALPEEILDYIFEYLPKSALCALALTSKWSYQHAIGILWREVRLIDCRKDDVMVYDETGANGPFMDEHCDVEILHKLYLLARKPEIAACVKSLTHRCHLPLPEIFTWLPNTCFESRNLSCSADTQRLLWFAIKNMVRLETVRVIFGHWPLTYGILRAIFAPDRQTPVKRLWIESSSLAGFDEDTVSQLSMQGVEKIRLRRIHLVQDPLHVAPRFYHSRTGEFYILKNGAGDTYETTLAGVRPQWTGLGEDPEISAIGEPSPTIVQSFDNQSMRLVGAREFLSTNTEEAPVMDFAVARRINAELVVDRLHAKAAATITSLCLDWAALKSRRSLGATEPGILGNLAKLTFPKLRAFQIRNAVVRSTKLPAEVYLLEEPGSDAHHAKVSFLAFMERHPYIRCLAWPMDKFYHHAQSSVSVRDRAARVVEQLAHGIEDLRVDTDFKNDGEPVTERPETEGERLEQLRRRWFIEHFASRMERVTSIKLEGGIPRDERRETLRALRKCPLNKIVMIGATCPIANFWGEAGRELFSRHPDEDELDGSGLEDEPVDTSYYTADIPTTVPGAFEPTYGWPFSPPFLYTIASHYSHTVTELKICGWKGAPLPEGPLAFLSPLRHFHNLQRITILWCFVTLWEGRHRDGEILDYWANRRSPTSTALVLANPDADEENSWAKKLREWYDPPALAVHIAQVLGEHLSPQAKKRAGGVEVRASFVLGREPNGDIFDMDFRVGEGNAVVGDVVGPRPECDAERCKEKLEGRRWF